MCVIPSEYQLEIEDYSEDGSRAIFAWKHPDEEEMGIWIELDGNGHLIDLTKDKSTEEVHHDIFDQDELKKKALQFAEIHYPGAVNMFMEEHVHKIDENLRISYIQMELDLPLPFTGFYIDINEHGEIMQFHYDGPAEHIVFPEFLLPEEKVKCEFLKDMKMNLIIVHLNRELYENGDNLPHLVYEPELLFYEIPVDGKQKVFIENEEDKEQIYKRLPKLESGVSPEALTELGAGFAKIREQDFGDAIGEVYRKHGDEPAAADHSIMTFFNKRNENTIKVKRDKETGKLIGFISFIETVGNQWLSIKECEMAAVQFLNAIYPDAHLYFQMDLMQIESDEGRALFQFDLIHHGISVRYGAARINVNRTTGKITHYLGPEVLPRLLLSIDPHPEISKDKAIEIFGSVFQIEKQWAKAYKDNSERYYQLV
nr:YcdB/YcdC domain-containing protein [Bacillus sp. V2I10]